MLCNHLGASWAYRTHIFLCMPQKSWAFGSLPNPWPLRGPPKIRSLFRSRTRAEWNTVHRFEMPWDRRSLWEMRFPSKAVPYGKTYEAPMLSVVRSSQRLGAALRNVRFVAGQTQKPPLPALFRLPNFRRSFTGARPTCSARGMPKSGTSCLSQAICRTAAPVRRRHPSLARPASHRAESGKVGPTSNLIHTSLVPHTKCDLRLTERAPADRQRLT